MFNDALADGVGINKTDIKDERDEMVFKDDRLEVQIGWDEDPGYEVW